MRDSTSAPVRGLVEHAHELGSWADQLMVGHAGACDVAPAVVGRSCWWARHAHLISGVVAGWPSGAGASGERVLNRRTSRRWKGALPRGLGAPRPRWGRGPAVPPRGVRGPEGGRGGLGSVRDQGVVRP